MIERRSIFKCLVGLVAAPAIIKVSSLMPVNAALQPGVSMLASYEPGEAAAALDVLYGSLRLADTITWEAMARGQELRQFVVTDGSLSVREVTEEAHDMSGAAINARYQAQFAADRAYFEGMQWSQAEMQRVSLRYNKERWSIDRVLPQVVGPLALAVAAVAVAPAVLERPVTRRFWSK